MFGLTGLAEPVIAPAEVLELTVAALRRSAELNRDRWPAAVAALSPAATIWSTGLGKSAFVAQKFAATLRSFGRGAHFLHPVEALHGDAGALGPNDAIVAVSASGHTQELIRFLNGTPLPVVALTRPATAVADRATAVIDASVEREAGGLAPVTSYAVAGALADALALQLRPDDALLHPGGHVGLAGRRVGSLMLPAPLVAPDSLVSACIPLLQHGAVLLVGGGIFTDGDLRRAVGADAAALGRPVRNFATHAPVTVAEGEPASTALERMERRSSQLSVLPVVDASGAYVGLVRLHDLVRAGLGE